MTSAGESCHGSSSFETNLGGVVVELQIVVDDGVVDVVGLDEVLEAPRSLLGVCLDVVHLDGRQVDGLRGIVGAGDETAEEGHVGEEGHGECLQIVRGMAMRGPTEEVRAERRVQNVGALKLSLGSWIVTF
ncbi:hypothetical protein HYQ46_010339 [Verticillium longisporum]|nr:hypothetical protein HYQ46_010339 [Verticillium longisporum]